MEASLHSLKLVKLHTFFSFLESSQQIIQYWSLRVDYSHPVIRTVSEANQIYFLNIIALVDDSHPVIRILTEASHVYIHF